jgi:hypothetical protein
VIPDSGISLKESAAKSCPDIVASSPSSKSSSSKSPLSINSSYNDNSSCSFSGESFIFILSSAIISSATISTLPVGAVAIKSSVMSSGGKGATYSSKTGELNASIGSSITVGFAPHDCQFKEAGTNLSNF